MIKIRKPRGKIEYTVHGESMFFFQDGIYYLKKSIERRFYNGMTWGNHGTLWRIRPQRKIGEYSFGINGKPEMIDINIT
jgi:hypothetical protein